MRFWCGVYMIGMVLTAVPAHAAPERQDGRASLEQAYRTVMSQPVGAEPDVRPVSPRVAHQRRGMVPLAPETYARGLEPDEAAVSALGEPQDRTVGMRIRPAASLSMGAELFDPHARRGTDFNLNWAWQPLQGSAPAVTSTDVTWGAGFAGRLNPTGGQLGQSLNGHVGLRTVVPGQTSVTLTPQLRPHIAYDHVTGRATAAAVTPSLGATTRLPGLSGGELNANVAYPVSLMPGARSAGVNSSLRFTIRSR